MKILKLLLVFTLVSTIALSCKESKKEEVSEDAVEMTEESEAVAEDDGAAAAAASDAEDDGSSDAAAGAAAGAGAAAAASSASDSEEGEEVIEVVETDVVEVETLVIPAGVIEEELADTPVVYPGCTGSVEEIRACNKESFIAYLKDAFNHDVAKDAGLKRGDYEIGVVMHVNKAGRVFSLRVIAPKKALENEMVRIINDTPKVTPATHKGAPVGVSLKFNVDFRVEKL
ncbi:hypothetical protein [Lutimonas sp.]|uniref:hypothetical protein n=1 Tax=Lutimonas sp. TaxID=1872403 RepID=UPI003D9B5598